MPTTINRGLTLAACVLGFALVVAARVSTVATADPDWMAPPARDFPLVGGNYFHQRYSALDKINTTNVPKLGGAWSIDLDDKSRRGQPYRGTPIVVDGIMYVTTGARNVIALDAATGAVKWRYRPDADGPSGGNFGVTVADGKVFFGRRDNVLLALDKNTGAVLWQMQITTEKGAFTTIAPSYVNGLVYIGTSGGDSGARGQVGAYDGKTGKEVWKFYTIPGPGDAFAETWEGESYKSGGGGVWTSAPVDPDLGMIYIQVGNIGLRQYGAADRGTPFFDELKRGGINLFTGSVVALDLKTGAYRWHFQQIHHDIWHYDAGGPSALADITYRGRTRKILMNPGKTGFLYILDRTDGKPLIGVEERPVPQEPRLKTSRTQPFPIGDPFVPICPDAIGTYERGCVFTPYWTEPRLIAPSTAGGNAFAPMTFSPKTGLAYVPASVLYSVFRVREDGATTAMRVPGSPRSGTLTAMDPTTNKIVWQRTTKYPMGGGSGLLSTAGGLLFHGQPDGNVVAFDIKDGKELWTFQTGAGADQPLMTYDVNGEQYVAAIAGGNSINLSQAGDLLWAFKLGGKVPPAPAPRQPPLVQPGDGAAGPAQ